MFGFLRRLSAGNRLMSSLLSGEFDNSEVGKRLHSWFAERPARNTQRQLFIQTVCSLGAKPESAAAKLMDCIMKARGGERFGDLLSRQLDEMITFDPPRDASQAEQQNQARALLNDFKKRLCSLDEVNA